MVFMGSWIAVTEQVNLMYEKNKSPSKNCEVPDALLIYNSLIEMSAKKEEKKREEKIEGKLKSINEHVLLPAPHSCIASQRCS
jgi:hypothetical protein